MQPTQSFQPIPSVDEPTLLPQVIQPTQPLQPLPLAQQAVQPYQVIQSTQQPLTQPLPPVQPIQQPEQSYQPIQPSQMPIQPQPFANLLLQPCPVCREGQVGQLELSDRSQIMVCDNCLVVWPANTPQPLSVEASIDALQNYLTVHGLTLPPIEVTPSQPGSVIPGRTPQNF